MCERRSCNELLTLLDRENKNTAGQLTNHTVAKMADKVYHNPSDPMARAIAHGTHPPSIKERLTRKITDHTSRAGTRPAPPPPLPPPRPGAHLAFSKRQHDPVSLERPQKAVLPHRPLRGHLAASAHELPPGKPPGPYPPPFHHQLHDLRLFRGIKAHLLDARIYDRRGRSGRRNAALGSARSDCLGGRPARGRRRRTSPPALD